MKNVCRRCMVYNIIVGDQGIFQLFLDKAGGSNSSTYSRLLSALFHPFRRVVHTTAPLPVVENHASSRSE